MLPTDGSGNESEEITRSQPGRSPGRSRTPDTWKAVRTAADRLVGRLAATGAGQTDEEEVGQRMEVLLQALRTGVEHPGTDLRIQSRDTGALRNLLELLYNETLQAWARQSPPPAAADMLRWLTSFERLREVVSSLPDAPSLGGTTQPLQSSDLLVELAHDLRSPLTSIIFLAESLRGGHAGAVNDLQRRQLGIIYSAALNLTSMASDVIELSRGSSRLIDRQPSPFSVTELLESTREILEPIVEEKKLAMQIIAPDADQRSGHPVALSRVLLNLATNATKFTESGLVEVAARAKGPVRLEFSVRDTGPGIDDRTQRELFQPFKLNPKSNRFGLSGSGLGLVISRRLVSAMGGVLHYETAPDRGTRFFFELDLPPLSSA